MLLNLGWVPQDAKKTLWVDHLNDGFGPDGMTTDAAIKYVRDMVPRQYLGKAVRWYYGAGQTGHIAYAGNGNLVAKSEGAKPCMELPHVLPPDINYQWYVDEAKSILRDIGVAY